MKEYAETARVFCALNGVETELVAAPSEPASNVLRRQRLFSVRETCAVGVCGTCTVLLNGEPVSTCILPAYALDGQEVTTVEGLAEEGLSPIQEAFIEKQAFQCSFCTPGFVMSAHALLQSGESGLTDDDLEAGLSGHLCRCGCYASILEAVRACAQEQ